MALLVTRAPDGFSVKHGGLSSFTACVGASDLKTLGPIPDLDAVRRTRSVRLTSEDKPDATTTAVYDDIWFSTEEIAA